MPVVTREQRMSNVGPLTNAPVVSQIDEPSFFRDEIPAAFRRENPLAKMAGWYAEPRPRDTDPLHEPFKMIEGTIYGEYPEAFIHTGSKAETAWIMRRIDQELEDRRTLQAGGLSAVAATMMMGFLDPINLVPVGGVVARSVQTGDSVLNGAARAALAGFVGSGASESFLMGSQHTRELSESAVNIAASTFLSGILGGAAAGLTLKQRASLVRSVEQDMDLTPRVAGGSDVAPDQITLTPEKIQNPKLLENELQGALGLEKLTAMLRASPGLRIDVKSPFIQARLFRQKLADAGYFYTKNALGGPTPVSVESIGKGPYESMHAAYLAELRQSFINYRRRIEGKPQVGGVRDIRDRLEGVRIFVRDKITRNTDDMDWKEFKEEISHAAIRNDASVVPEVQHMAQWSRRHVVDPIKDRSIEAGRLPADVKPEGAPSYLTRLYKAELIRQDPDDSFRHFIADKFAANIEEITDGKVTSITEEEALEIATQVRRHIIGTPGGRTSYEAIEFSGTSPVKNRSLGFIKDESLERFLERDHEMIIDHYIRTMAGDNEIALMFPDAVDKQTGKLDFDAAFKPVLDEAEEMIARAAPKDRASLEKSLRADARDLRAMWELERGTFRGSATMDPDQFWPRAGRVSRQGAYMSLGGGFVVNSLPDPGNIVMRNGLWRSFRHGLVPLIRNVDAAKMGKGELRIAAATVENLTDTRAMSLADISDDYRPHTRFERALSALSNTFSLVTGHSSWNTFMKQWAGLVTHHRILEVANDVLEGRPVKASDVNDLAQLGFDMRNMDHMRRIGEQVRAHGRLNSNADEWVSNTDAWTDTSIRDLFRITLRRAVDQTIVTPGTADRPPLMSRDLGKVIGQFKSFSFSTVTRNTIPALQKKDLAVLNGMGLALGMGTLVYMLKEKLAGREINLDPMNIIREAVDRSGHLGFYADINNIAEVATRRTVGFSALTGGPVVSRYAQRNDLGNLLGPSARIVGNITDITGAISTGEFSQSQSRTMRRMLPYQNVWYLSRLFDEAEDGVNQAFNIPAKRRSIRRRRR